MKLPVPLEKDILRQIKQYLELAGCLVIRCNSGAVSAIHNGKKRFLRFNSEPGLSDLICCMPTNFTYCGLFLALEVKRTKGTRATPQQKAFGYRVGMAGGTWAVVSSVEDVRKILVSMGAAKVP